MKRLAFQMKCITFIIKWLRVMKMRNAFVSKRNFFLSERNSFQNVRSSFKIG